MPRAERLDIAQLGLLDLPVRGHTAAAAHPPTLANTSAVRRHSGCGPAEEPPAQRSPARGHVPGEVIDHRTRVVLDAADGTWTYAAQHRAARARTVPGLSTTPPSVPQLALGVEDGHVEPPVVGPKPVAQTTVRNTAAAQVELQPRQVGTRVGAERSGASNSASRPAVRAHSSTRPAACLSPGPRARARNSRKPPENRAWPSRTIARTGRSARRP